MDLTEFRFVSGTMGVNIMSLEILAVDASSVRWFGISITISMKSWLSKVSSDR
jgi:hypothetical protein